MNNIGKISIIIPTINESINLPLLLADINIYPYEYEIIIVDAGSSDKTVLLANLSGSKVIETEKCNRGDQLKEGAIAAQGEWLIFLHADSRLSNNWAYKLIKVINNPPSWRYGWYFNLTFNKKGIHWYLLQLVVAIRSNIFQISYGDQGLLINRELYFEIGGYKPIYLMEDLDFVIRLTKKTKIKCIGTEIKTSTRKYDQTNIILNALKNARLRNEWRKGRKTIDLAKKYYSINKNN